METTFQFVSDPDLEESFGQSADSASLLVPSKGLKSFSISSPDCRDVLSIVFDKPDFSSERVHVLISPASSKAATTDYRFDFDLTSFAFPFTDNAVLPSGNRFAFFIKDVSNLDDTGTSKIMRIGLRWFPQNLLPADGATHGLQAVPESVGQFGPSNRQRLRGFLSRSSSVSKNRKSLRASCRICGASSRNNTRPQLLLGARVGMWG